MHAETVEGEELSLEEIIAKMLKRYDAVEIKKVNGQWQFIGINRKLEFKTPAK